MKVVVAYESIYGNTRAVAEEVAQGLRPASEVVVASLRDVDPGLLEGVDLLVVGGPTHMHGLSSSKSRELAVNAAEEEGLHVEPGAADGPGLREWLAAREGAGARAAAFDTRLDKSPVLTGAAARGIAKRLRRRGYELVGDPESFLVEDSEGPLVEGELERAREWGASLAGRIAPAAGAT